MQVIIIEYDPTNLRETEGRRTPIFIGCFSLNNLLNPRPSTPDDNRDVYNTCLIVSLCGSYLYNLYGSVRANSPNDIKMLF